LNNQRKNLTLRAEKVLVDGSIMVEARRIPTTLSDTHDQALDSLQVIGRSSSQSIIYTAKAFAFHSKVTNQTPSVSAKGSRDKGR